MNDAQRERFLPKFLGDDRYHLAFASREPGTDTRLGVNYHRIDASEPPLKTIAVKASDGGWIVNGTKDCVANAPIAGLFAVEVQIAGRPTTNVLLVPADAPGVTVQGARERLAARLLRRLSPSRTAEFLPTICSATMPHLCLPARLRPAAATRWRKRSVLGVGRAAYETALDYAHLRVQGGRPLIEHQAIANKLAEIAIKLEIARAAVWQAAWAPIIPRPSPTAAFPTCRSPVWRRFSPARRC